MGMAFRARVLVVDDDRTIAETLAALLRLHEFDARPAYSGKSAVQLAARFEPEVLITDVVMPGMNGVETASHIRSLFPQCKVLLITGRSAAADLVVEDTCSQRRIRTAGQTRTPSRHPRPALSSS